MTQYRKKPVVVDAWEFQLGAPRPGWLEDAISNGAIFAFMDDDTGKINRLSVHTEEGIMAAHPGDWIVKGVIGELYPCKPDIFALTSEAVRDPAPEGFCELCGERLPPGEEMFKYHGYSGPCPVKVAGHD